MNSKLLKEAIADAKAVRETALANAKIALEEAFTPKLQSMLSRKLKEEMEGDEDEDDKMNENDESSEIGKGDNKQPATVANSSSEKTLELGKAGVKKETAPLGLEDPNRKKVSDLTEGEDEEEVKEGEERDPEHHDVTGASPESGVNEGEEEDDEYADGKVTEGEDADADDLDLDEIIRELESDIEKEPKAEGEGWDDEDHQTEGEEDAPKMEEPAADGEDEIDLDEILREMGYGDDEQEAEPTAEGEDDTLEIEDEPKTEGEEEKFDALKKEVEEKEEELEEAYNVIKSLKGTINEVNLLNAKLLYVNKLFRSYNLTNEQKTKVVETLDRTKNVREVKLVYSTIAESFRFGNGIEKKATAKKLTESYTTKTAKSTAPVKQIISENTVADRFKKLAGINKVK